MKLNASFLHESLVAWKRDTAEGLHCAAPGNLISYDPDAGTADLQPARRRALATGELPTAPIRSAVPVLLPSTDYIPQPGDPCILLFMDFCLDGWLESGQPVLPPSPRRHDWADAVAMVGFFPAARR